MTGYYSVDYRCTSTELVFDPPITVHVITHVGCGGIACIMHGDNEVPRDTSLAKALSYDADCGFCECEK